MRGGFRTYIVLSFVSSGLLLSFQSCMGGFSSKNFPNTVSVTAQPSQLSPLPAPSPTATGLKSPLHGIMAMGTTSFNVNGGDPNNLVDYQNLPPTAFDGVVINVTWNHWNRIKAHMLWIASMPH